MILQNKTIVLMLSLCLELMGVFIDEFFTILELPAFMIYYILKIEEVP
jgi:hypothetical protein